MKALVVIDTQEVIVNHKPFDTQMNNIKRMIDEFHRNGDQVLFTQQIDTNPDSFFYEKNENVKIVDGLVKENSFVHKKNTPSIFKDGTLDEYFKKNDIDHLYMVGFNTEYCCMFSAIAAYDRGYKVTIIEDAMGSANDEVIYEMPGLDINDFVGTVLDWSGAVEVLYVKEFFGEE